MINQVKITRRCSGKRPSVNYVSWTVGEAYLEAAYARASGRIQYFDGGRRVRIPQPGKSSIEFCWPERPEGPSPTK